MGVIEAFDVPCPLSKPLHVTMDSFYKLRIKQAMEVYDKIVEHFWNSVLKVPTLVFYSENDPLCDSLYIQEILKNGGEISWLWRHFYFMEEIQICSRSTFERTSQGLF